MVKVFKETPIHFPVKDLLTGVDWPVEVIVANILPHILVNMLEDAHRLLTSDGYLILGGILNEKADQLLEDLEAHGFRLVQRVQLKGWTGLVTQKQED